MEANSECPVLLQRVDTQNVVDAEVQPPSKPEPAIAARTTRMSSVEEEHRAYTSWRTHGFGSPGSSREPAVAAQWGTTARAAPNKPIRRADVSRTVTALEQQARQWQQDQKLGFWRTSESAEMHVHRDRQQDRKEAASIIQEVNTARNPVSRAVRAMQHDALSIEREELRHMETEAIMANYMEADSLLRAQIEAARVGFEVFVPTGTDHWHWNDKLNHE